MPEDLEFAADQGRKYGAQMAELFEKHFAQPRDSEFIQRWFLTLTAEIGKSVRSIYDRGGSSAYAQAFTKSVFATMDPHIKAYTSDYRESLSK